ncbi:hypothetical protein PSHT_02902 [Puccinia striiformis]|uniref:Uncharacterized protein n=1 Tax=Puccinia striiformis TaxID=27350 RepID=A0A2S4WGX4_9BASI|nr:hypothetical protein PSHT_02902 [Puccinia striiformis]
MPWIAFVVTLQVKLARLSQLPSNKLCGRITAPKHHKSSPNSTLHRVPTLSLRRNISVPLCCLLPTHP